MCTHSSELILKMEFIPLLIVFHECTPLFICLSVRSTHSWSWPSLCPASPRSSWQPRRPWGATAKSQSLKTIRADANDSQASQTSQHLLLVYVWWPSATCKCLCFFSKGHKIPLRSSPCFCTDARYILPLCLVLNPHTAIMCFLFAAAVAHMCCWCWLWLRQNAYQECRITVAKVQDSLHTKGHIHQGSYLTTGMSRQQRYLK